MTDITTAAGSSHAYPHATHLCVFTLACSARGGSGDLPASGSGCRDSTAGSTACPASAPKVSSSHPQPRFAQTHLCVVFQRIQLPLVEHAFPFALLQNEQTRKKNLHHSIAKGKK